MKTRPRSKPRAELISEFRYGVVARRYTDGLAIKQEDRDKGAKSGAAMPDGSYLITACTGGEGDPTVENAVHAVGRGGADHDAIRKHIITRADSLGCKDLIPDNWNADGSLKESGSESALASGACSCAMDCDCRVDGACQFATCPHDAIKLAADPRFPDGMGPEGDDADEQDEGKGGSGDDAPVTEAIADLRAALKKAQDAQGQEDDADTDPNDLTVAADLAQISELLDKLEKDQAMDVAAESKAAPAPAPSDGGADGKDEGSPGQEQMAAPPGQPPVGRAPAPLNNPKGDPVDDDGNVDPETQCADPDCMHLASMHQDTATGKNSGPCTTEGCSCEAMKVDTSTIADEGGGGPNNAAGDDVPAPTDDAARTSRGGVALAVGDAGDEADAPAPASDAVAAPEPNKPPMLPTGETLGGAFTIPVGVIMNQPTGDGRSIAPDALDWRVPPLPLMGLATSPHDPSGFSPNDPAVLCGIVESLEVAPGEAETQVVRATGHYLATSDGSMFEELVEQMGRMGVSADIAVEASTMSAEELDDDGFPTAVSEVLTKGTIMGFTLCPFPAFEGCYIVNGDGSDEPDATAIPQAAEVPAVVAAGGQLIHWMAYEDCGCSSDVDVIVAAGAPVRPPAAWFADPLFSDADPRMRRMASGRLICPPTVLESGEVFGHIAPFGECHVGIQGACVMAPRSRSGYAQFLRGQYLVTAEGEEVRVGTITADIGHASTKPGTPVGVAMAHYDDTRFAAAYVAVGEDRYGIWYHGTMSPRADEAQFQAMRAASPSGDWRRDELVAVLMVNEPGFPQAIVADGRVETILAAGAMSMARVQHPERFLALEPADELPAGADRALRLALAPLLRMQRDAERRRLQAATARHRLAAAAR